MSGLAIGITFAAQIGHQAVQHAAQAQQAAPRGPDFGIFLMFGSLFAIFYFLVLRPQQKQRRELEESIKTASKGDHAITAGGLHGKIVATDEETFTLEIASLKGQSVRVQVSRSKVESVGPRSAVAKSQASGEDKSSGSDASKAKGKNQSKDSSGGGAGSQAAGKDGAAGKSWIQKLLGGGS